MLLQLTACITPARCEVKQHGRLGLPCLAGFPHAFFWSVTAANFEMQTMIQSDVRSFSLICDAAGGYEVSSTAMPLRYIQLLQGIGRQVAMHWANSCAALCCAVLCCRPVTQHVHVRSHWPRQRSSRAQSLSLSLSPASAALAARRSNLLTALAGERGGLECSDK